jgi:hypothetical protein
MKPKLKKVLAALAILIMAALPALGAEVSQGKCVSFDQQSHTITIEEYDTQFSKENPYGQPTGVTSVFNVAQAMIGIPPAAGDILRLAYTVKGTEKMALKVMNVSKQDLQKK